MVVGLMTSACGEKDSDDTPSVASSTTSTTATTTSATITVAGEPVAVSLLTDAVSALCDVRSRAGAGDRAGAAATFFDRSHDPLHTLARGLEDLDRASAARLLEAKQEVEGDLDDESDPGLLAAAVTELHTSAAGGLSRLGIEVPACAA